MNEPHSKHILFECFSAMSIYDYTGKCVSNSHSHIANKGLKNKIQQNFASSGARTQDLLVFTVSCLADGAKQKCVGRENSELNFVLCCIWIISSINNRAWLYKALKGSDWEPNVNLAQSTRHWNKDQVVLRSIAHWRLFFLTEFIFLFTCKFLLTTLIE